MSEQSGPKIEIAQLTRDGKAAVCQSLKLKLGLTFAPASSVPGGPEDILLSKDPVYPGSAPYTRFLNLHASGEKVRYKGYDPKTGKFAGAPDDCRVVVDHLSGELAGIAPRRGSPNTTKPRP